MHACAYEKKKLKKEKKNGYRLDKSENIFQFY